MKDQMTFMETNIFVWYILLHALPLTLNEIPSLAAIIYNYVNYLCLIYQNLIAHKIKTGTFFVENGFTPLCLMYLSKGNNLY